jgi:hypothetical protein
MAEESAEVERTLRRAEEFAERAVTRQADAPPTMYWYSSGFFTPQRDLTWHTLGDPRVAHTQMRDNWPAYPPVGELGDELRPLSHCWTQVASW